VIAAQVAAPRRGSAGLLEVHASRRSATAIGRRAGPLVQAILPVIEGRGGKFSGIEVRVECPLEFCRTSSADPSMLEQGVLESWAETRVRRCENGGRLRIAAAVRPREPRRDPPSRTPASASHLRDLARIFDLYFTTKEHGSGIGLSLVYRTISAPRRARSRLSPTPGPRHEHSACCSTKPEQNFSPLFFQSRGASGCVIIVGMGQVGQSVGAGSSARSGLAACGGGSSAHAAAPANSP